MAWDFTTLPVFARLPAYSQVAQLVEQVAVNLKTQLFVERRIEKSGEFREAPDL